MRRGALILAAALAGCGTKCPPEEPCVETDAGVVKAPCVARGTCGTGGTSEEGVLVFDCGKARCRGPQLCVAAATCGEGHDFGGDEAACVDRPAACSEVQSQCAYAMGSPPDAGTYCCRFAGWAPYSFNICNFACQ